MRHSTLLIMALLLVCVCASAQDDDGDARRWAIDAQVGGNIVQSATSNNTDVPKYRSGSTSNSGLLTKLHVEYYLPKTSFSLKAGYEREQLRFLKGDGCNELNQLMLGGRWYPAPTIGRLPPMLALTFSMPLTPTVGHLRCHPTCHGHTAKCLRRHIAMWRKA